MKRFFLLAMIASSAISMNGQKTVTIDTDADETVVLWNNKTAPHSNEETKDEVYNNSKQFFNTSETNIFVYKAAPQKATGQAIVMISGGGYAQVNIGGSFTLGKYLRDAGITAVVLKYRLPNFGHPDVPLEDVQEAMKWIRKNANRLNVDPKKVGVFGSSAGGHLAAFASTFTPDADKPAFAVLLYPVITGTTWFTHQGSFDYLLGKNRTPQQTEKYSLENSVTETTPPTILFLSDDDRVVPTISSIKYYEQLKNHGVKSSMHIYPSGGHGWSGSEKFKYCKQFREAMLEWILGLNK